MLGDGTTMAYRADELLPVYRSQARRTAGSARPALRQRGRRQLGRRHRAGMHALPGMQIQVRAHDDLLLVANMRVTQRARLIDAGITTLTELAHHDGPVPGLSARTATALNRQAALQITPRADGEPPYEWSTPATDAAARTRTRGDLFFDFEGDPLWTADGRGVGPGVPVRRSRRQDDFTPLGRTTARPNARRWWTSPGDGAQTRPASVIRGCTSTTTPPTRRPRCCGWPGRYGVGEGRGRRPAARRCAGGPFSPGAQSVQVGTENYSLKSLEPLYMGSELRAGDVTTATDSITMYARYTQLRAEGPRRRGGKRAQGGRGLQPLRLPVHPQAAGLAAGPRHRCGVPPLGPQPGRDTGQVEVDDDVAGHCPFRRRRRRRPHPRTARGGDDRSRPRLSPPGGQAVLVGPLRPAQQPGRRMGRHARVFLADEATVDADWHVPQGARKPQRWVRLTGSLAASELTGEIFALYDPPTGRAVRRPGAAGLRRGHHHRL